ncbi:hypothetical protein N799_05670 [Lysobacter arseniciresistens ZS79]|uniref:ABC transporter permease n=1 Tax=Lysobacter arseniciresistens ZS79 TaxID=913325 RepID=A0A0A0F4T5_9GAMM|nr:ABC transporter permease [Lysobacter arseniciresistens]KGM57545.1 hypothetical protein N799_05670 [Lysobacter arseniciresistens ZS79]
MTALLRALSAEALKLRGTLALWMCLVAPAAVVALITLKIASFEPGNRPMPAPEDAWFTFAQQTLVFWAFLMLPLFVTLQSALLAGLEHGNRQWKHLLALPLPRGAHYLAKQFALTATVTLAMASLLVLIPLGGWLLALLQPGSGIAGAPPWAFLATRIGACLVAALLIIALHHWISIRWRSFTVAVSVGMIASVGSILIGQSERFGHLYPWSIPAQVLAGRGGERIEMAMLIGLIGGLVVTGLGLWSFVRRDDI